MSWSTVERPSAHAGGNRLAVPNRLAVAGSAHRVRPLAAVWERHKRWSTDGTYAKMFAAVRDETGVEDEELLELISIDSTSFRAHQHAAGD